MQNKEEIQTALDELISRYGEWAFDIPLPHGIWTRGNRQVPHTRLRRIVQVVSDVVTKPLGECRILDLGCLDGIFSIEFASQGSETVGVEIREANIRKAQFCKDVLELQNLHFRQDDVRNISVESYGHFDAIVCSGILYHLPAQDVINLIDRMYDMVNDVIVIDTHIALNPIEQFVSARGTEYWGRIHQEHADGATKEEKASRLWASADNPTSFFYTRPSLLNVLGKAGFTSVYECYNPPHLNFGRPGIEHQDRCTFVAVKGDLRQIKTSPVVNSLHENWPEHSITYCSKSRNTHKPRLSLTKVLQKMKGILVGR